MTWGPACQAEGRASVDALRQDQLGEQEAENQGGGGGLVQAWVAVAGSGGFVFIRMGGCWRDFKLGMTPSDLHF